VGEGDDEVRKAAAKRPGSGPTTTVSIRSGLNASGASEEEMQALSKLSAGAGKGGFGDSKNALPAVGHVGSKEVGRVQFAALSRRLRLIRRSPLRHPPGPSSLSLRSRVRHNQGAVDVSVVQLSSSTHSSTLSAMPPPTHLTFAPGYSWRRVGRCRVYLRLRRPQFCVFRRLRNVP
jgi:hypothetical protein